MHCLTCRRLLPVLIALLTVVVLAGLPGPLAQQQAPDPNTAPAEAEAPADQQQPAAETEPTFRAGINFIRVDVIVTDDDGNLVRDLDVSDFQVLEDGEPQNIESFQLIEIGPVPEPDAEPARPVINRYDEEREAARADTRIFVVFFDDYHVRWENGVRAGRTLARFLRENLLATDMVGIMYPLTPLDDVRLTRNHEAIAEAAENFYGVKYDYQPRNMFEQRYTHYPTEIVERLRNDVSLSALEGLMIRLGGLREGRKNVLLISEGFSNYVPVELRSMNAEMFGGPRSRRWGTSATKRPPQFFSDSGLIFDLRDVYSTANRFNTTIYSLDPRGLAISEYDVSQRSVNRRTDDRMLRSTRDTPVRPGAGDRRPHHHELERPAARAQPDAARFERLLPVGVQLVPGADGRQVPRDRGTGAARRCGRAASAGVLGADRAGHRARDDAGDQRAAESGRHGALGARRAAPRPAPGAHLDRSRQGRERAHAGHLPVGAGAGCGRPR